MRMAILFIVLDGAFSLKVHLPQVSIRKKRSFRNFQGLGRNHLNLPCSATFTQLSFTLVKSPLLNSFKRDGNLRKIYSAYL